MSQNNKDYIYRVYRSGVYKGLWTDVISDFYYDQEINAVGSSVTLVLGRAADSYGEGTNLDFNNKVMVYCVDDESPNGTLVFQGTVASYKPIFGDSERVEVVLEGFGTSLDNYMIESGEAVDVNQNSQNANTVAIQGTNSKSGAFQNVYQSVVVGAAVTKLSSLEFYLAPNISYIDTGATVQLRVFTSATDAESGSLTSLIASASKVIDRSDPAAYRFSFASLATVTPGQTLYCTLSYAADAPGIVPGSFGITGYAGQINVYYDNTSPYTSGVLKTVTFNGVSYSASAVSGDAYIKTYSATGSTTSAYASMDPSAILRSIIDNYNSQGGTITYTAASIDDTSTTVTYTFRTNTIKEGLDKCLQMAPPGWYYYIDQANNVLHFHRKSSTATKKFILGKHIQNLSVDKRVQDLVNVVYFVGGQVAGVNLFKKFVQQSSVDLYGRRAIRISDNNVTLDATATTIANSYLTDMAQVNLRIEMDIVDNGGQAANMLGFNLETITLGEMASFEGFGPQSSGSQWDVSKWDIAKWDFDITDLSSLVVQITRVNYKPDIVHLSMSTVPPDVTKRIEDIQRNVDQLNAENNPSTPT